MRHLGQCKGKKGVNNLYWKWDKEEFKKQFGVSEMYITNIGCYSLLTIIYGMYLP